MLGRSGDAGTHPGVPTLVVPLILGHRAAGAIYLEAAGAAFDNEDLQLLMAVATLSAIALENVRRVASLERETERLKLDAPEPKLVGDSPPILALNETIRRVSRAQTTVLLTGETGTGKEIAARTIHMNSPRANRPFVAVNCAALAENLLESELFGHERGAFSGAVGTEERTHRARGVGHAVPRRNRGARPGHAEQAAARAPGTGARAPRRHADLKVDIRLISATNRDLDAEVKAGRFRDDLLYRIKVVQIEMPPLRDRPADIPALARHFLENCRGKVGRHVTGISPEAMACLRAYDWPGNVRELENAIERAVVLGSTDEILPGGPSRSRRRSACPRGKRRGREHPFRHHRGQEEGGPRRVQGQRGELHRDGAHAGCSPELSAPPDQEPRHQGTVERRRVAVRVRPGTRLGRYEVVSHLATGGMGEVYRALDTHLDRFVALKTVAERFEHDATSQPRFERERRLSTSLEHPHICRVLDAGREDGIEYFAMELLEGESLARRLERGAIPFEQAVGYAIEIADALCYAHGHAVIHRDLKPANVFLTSTGAKVLDFGLAKVRSGVVKGAAAFRDTVPLDVSQPGTLIGSTPLYAARAPRRRRSRHAQRHLRVRRRGLRDGQRPPGVSRRLRGLDDRRIDDS